jgi:hypothetical protein
MWPLKDLIEVSKSEAFLDNLWPIKVKNWLNNSGCFMIKGTTQIINQLKNSIIVGNSRFNSALNPYCL